MIRRVGWLVVVAALAALPVPVSAADTEPTLILRVRSLESIAEDVKYLAELVGQADAVQQGLNQLPQLPGLDLKKPLGVYASLSPGIVDSNFAVLVPVKSEQEFITLLGILGQQPEKDKEGIYSLSLPQIPFPIHFRIANGYAYATIRDKEALSKDKLIAPAKILPAGQQELAVLSVRLDQIPNEIRQLAVSQVELRLPELLEQKNAGDTEAQHKFKQAAGKELAGLITALLKEGREIRLHLDLDRKAHTSSLQLSVDAASKSALAASIAALGKSPSPVAGLMKGDAAITGGFNVTLPASVSNALHAALEEAMRQGLQQEQNPAAKALATKLFKAVEPSLKAGKFQSAVSLRGPLASGKFTFVGGSALQNARQVEQTLRDIIKELPAEVQAAIQVDHAKVGAVSIHKVTPPSKDLDQGWKNLFGEGPIFVALTGDASYAAFGENALEALKGAVVLKPAPAPLLQVDLAVSRLAGLSEGVNQKQVVAVANKVFQGADKNHDKVHILVEGGTGLRVRLEANTALLKFFHLVNQGQ